jgi:hypothetical protein
MPILLNKFYNILLFGAKINTLFEINKVYITYDKKFFDNCFFLDKKINLKLPVTK